MVLLNYIGLYIYIYAYKTKELKELIQERLTVVLRLALLTPISK